MDQAVPKDDEHPIIDGGQAETGAWRILVLKVPCSKLASQWDLAGWLPGAKGNGMEGPTKQPIALLCGLVEVSPKENSTIAPSRLDIFGRPRVLSKTG